MMKQGVKGKRMFEEGDYVRVELNGTEVFPDMEKHDVREYLFDDTVYQVIKQPDGDDRYVVWSVWNSVDGYKWELRARPEQMRKLKNEDYWDLLDFEYPCGPQRARYKGIGKTGGRCDTDGSECEACKRETFNKLVEVDCVKHPHQGDITMKNQEKKVNVGYNMEKQAGVGDVVTINEDFAVTLYKKKKDGGIESLVGEMPEEGSKWLITQLNPDMGKFTGESDMLLAIPEADKHLPTSERKRFAYIRPQHVREVCNSDKEKAKRLKTAQTKWEEAYTLVKQLQAKVHEDCAYCTEYSEYYSLGTSALKWCPLSEVCGSCQHGVQSNYNELTRITLRARALIEDTKNEINKDIQKLES